MFLAASPLVIISAIVFNCTAAIGGGNNFDRISKAKPRFVRASESVFKPARRLFEICIVARLFSIFDQVFVLRPFAVTQKNTDKIPLLRPTKKRDCFLFPEN